MSDDWKNEYELERRNSDRLAGIIEDMTAALLAAEHELISLSGLYATDLAAVVQYLKPDVYFQIDTATTLARVQKVLPSTKAA